MAIALSHLLVAQENEAETTNGYIADGVGIELLFPNNQEKSNNDFFDLLLLASEEQIVNIAITNFTDEEKRYNVAVNPGTTNENGVVVYSEKANKTHRRKEKVEELVSTENKIVIPPKDTTKLAINIKMISDIFDGVIVGAIHLTPIQESQEVPQIKKNEQQAVLSNEVSFIIGIQLRQSEHEVTGELDFKNAQLSNFSNSSSVSINLENKKRNFLDEVRYTAKIYNIKHEKEIANYYVENYRVAPDSSFSLQVPIKETDIESGKYRLVLTAESKSSNQKWLWNEIFEITKEEKAEISSNENPKNTEVIFWVIISLMTIVFIIIIKVTMLSRINKKK